MEIFDKLTRVTLLSGGHIGDVVRQVCAQTLGLPPLPTESAVGGRADLDMAVTEFAEQFSVDVSGISEEQRSRLFAVLENETLRATVLMYIADFVPRVRAGFAALGVGQEYLERGPRAVQWDHSSDLFDVVFKDFLSAVARLRALDPVTSEVIRLRVATQHNCRLCKSLRETTALDAGGSETLYDDVPFFENSRLLTDRHKAALRYVDELIWTPAHIPADVAAGVGAHFSDAEAVELTLNVMRHAANKIAVALGTDTPRVEHGTERYLIDADGQGVYDGPTPTLAPRAGQQTGDYGTGATIASARGDTDAG